MKRRASIVLPNRIVGSNIEEAFEVSLRSGIMPAGCVALLGTGAIARLDIAAGKVCKETHVTSGHEIECSYNRQPLLNSANATIMGPEFATGTTQHRVFWDGTVREQPGQRLARVQTETGRMTLVQARRMKVDGQMERGIPYCELRGSELTIELGACPRTGLRKQACCVKHHRQHKLFSNIGKTAEPQSYKKAIGI